MISLHKLSLTCRCCLILLFPATSLHASELDVRSEVPQIAMKPRAEGTRFLTLPALEYRFFLEARCTEGFAPETLSVGIADSRKSLRSAEIPAQEAFELTLPVPADQVGPVALHSFCKETAANEAGPSSLSLLIPAVVSAQFALICVNAGEREISYVSEPVDVMLTCEHDSGDDEAAAADL